MQIALAKQRIKEFNRRLDWVTRNVGVGQAANAALAGVEFALRREHLVSFPTILKVDISPLCNLRCTACVHARPAPWQQTLLEQKFEPAQKMRVDQFQELVREARGRSAAVSLYYLGDPLVHPQLEEICETTRAAGLNSHVSTNFSFSLTDERLRALLSCGLSHLTVCVDGMSQEAYGKTRVGGKISLVLSNLERLLQLRRDTPGSKLHVEVQFIKFQHNVHELDAVKSWCMERGVDQFRSFWGVLHNMTVRQTDPHREQSPRPTKFYPNCWWPYFSMVVKYNGDAIPCCFHRQGEQYRPDGDARPIGNVFDRGIREVWNSPPYKAARRLVSNPAKRVGEAGSAASFCSGCHILFRSQPNPDLRFAKSSRWEDLYEQDARGRVVPKPPHLHQISR